MQCLMTVGVRETKPLSWSILKKRLYSADSKILWCHLGNKFNSKLKQQLQEGSKILLLAQEAARHLY